MSDFKAKMHQNPKFGWGSAPDTIGGSLQRSPDPLAGFKGPTSKERGGQGRGGDGTGGMGGMGGRDGRGWEEMEGDGRGVLWSPKKSLK